MIRIYEKRQDTEVFFKTCKNFPNLGFEYHGLAYDALMAHTALAFTRCMLMAVAKRNDEDERTLGKLFHFMVNGVANVTFNQSMKILMDAMIKSIKVIFQSKDDQITRFTNDFISRLSDYMKESLLVTNNA